MNYYLAKHESVTIGKLNSLRGPTYINFFLSVLLARLKHHAVLVDKLLLLASHDKVLLLHLTVHINHVRVVLHHLLLLHGGVFVHHLLLLHITTIHRVHIAHVLLHLVSRGCRLWRSCFLDLLLLLLLFLGRFFLGSGSLLFDGLLLLRLGLFLLFSWLLLIGLTHI